MSLDLKRLSIEKLLPDIRRLEENKQWPGFKEDGRYGVDTYYVDYARLGHRFAPATILEIGVKYGYSAIALCKGSNYKTGRKVEYYGVDNQFFEGSNYEASCLIARFSFIQFTLYNHNILQGLPEELDSMRFDLIHLDANHKFPGILVELEIALQHVNKRGVIVIDDYFAPHLSEPVDDFLQILRDAEAEEDGGYVTRFSRTEVTYNERNQLIIVMKK